jgi:hypothetical protein
MDSEIEIRKVEAEPRRSIPAIAVTAVAMTLALAAIILAQKYFNPPAEHPHPSAVEQVR